MYYIKVKNKVVIFYCEFATIRKQTIIKTKNKLNDYKLGSNTNSVRALALLLLSLQRKSYTKAG
jgi:hypothetical protein